jgi:hypothetical protein
MALTPEEIGAPTESLPKRECLIKRKRKRKRKSENKGCNDAANCIVEKVPR